MAEPIRATDRRGQRALIDGLATVKAALRSRLSNPDGLDALELSRAIEAIAHFERSLKDDASVERAPRRGLTAAVGERFVAIVGVDRFSKVRDDLGQSDADKTVDALCDRIRVSASNVQLGRINSSSIEFTFSAPDMTVAEGALSELQRSLEAPIDLGNSQVSLEVVIGLAGRDANSGNLGGLVDRAEHALAKARANHAKVGVFTERDHAERVARLALMRDLGIAVTQGQLAVHYQPKLSLRASAITSIEALVRWPHPQHGFIPPDAFIPLAEETGEIHAVTQAVLRQVIGHSDRLIEAGHDIRIDVNISGVLVADTDFAAQLLKSLEGRERQFGLEITETAVIANPERALKNIGAFSKAGIAIAIDDYGSGLSSLSYLKQIPADELKIDKAFISGLTSSHRDPLLVRSTIDLAHALEMAVTAEGVDNALSLALLKAMGCDMIQGYQVSKPLPFVDLLPFLDQFDPVAHALPVGRAVG